MSRKQNQYVKGIVDRRTLIDAKTLTTVGSVMEVAGAKAVTLVLTAAANAGSRTGTLTLEVSNDNGTTYVTYIMLVDNLANTNTQHLTRIANKARNADGSDILFLTPETLGAITHIRPTVTVAGGSAGNFTLKAAACY